MSGMQTAPQPSDRRGSSNNHTRSETCQLAPGRSDFATGSSLQPWTKLRVTRLRRSRTASPNSTREVQPMQCSYLILSQANGSPMRGRTLRWAQDYASKPIRIVSVSPDVPSAADTQSNSLRLYPDSYTTSSLSSAGPTPGKSFHSQSSLHCSPSSAKL